MKKFILSSLCVFLSLAASASDFFSTAAPDKFFGIGVRLGFNTSNSTIGKGPDLWNHSSWGTGFDAGVVADIAFRDFLTIQPGFFYESRSSSYTYIWSRPGSQQEVVVGHALNYTFQVPVIASVRFNVTDNVRWSLDIGPTFSFGIGKSDKGKYFLPTEFTYDEGYYKNRHKFEVGLKMGTGLTIRKHYYLGVHYVAGMRDVYKVDGLGGRNKTWTFTLGYDF